MKEKTEKRIILTSGLFSFSSRSCPSADPSEMGDDFLNLAASVMPEEEEFEYEGDDDCLTMGGEDKLLFSCEM